MNVPRRLIGKLVKIRWADPNSGRGPLDSMPKGRAALATWDEYGIVHDVTDSVVLLVHSYATTPGEDRPDEAERTAIHEALIEAVTIYAEEQEPRERA